ncbi:MAG: hypothetical protein Q9160_004738 [Pyrenula sp. 1 TL-2023]
MPSIPSPTTSPRRRVLADKTTNASLSASNSPRRKRGDKATGGYQRHHEVSSDRKAPMVTVGHKRTISQVEDSEQQLPRRSERDAYEDDSVMSSKDRRSLRQNVVVSSAEVQREKLQPPGHGSFHASQEPQPELETTFDIQEEVLGDSQVERLNATHILYDDSCQKKQDEVDQENSPSQQLQLSTQSTVRNDSQDSLHMSSFIDFSQNDADDKSLKIITPKSAKTQKSVDDDEEKAGARRKFMAEKAVLLRTNLQLAYHKIQTNQTTTPFRKLKSPPPKLKTSPTPSINSRYPDKLRDESPEPILPPFLPTLSLPTATSKIVQPRQSSIRTFNDALSPESRVSALRASATAQPKPLTNRPLKEIPEPKLLPTAYSARWADRPRLTQPQPHKEEPEDCHDSTPPTSTAQTSEEGQQAEKPKSGPQPSSPQLPSSPPPSNREASFNVLSDQPISAERSATPSPSTSPGKADETKGKEATPVQLSSPPGSRENSPSQVKMQSSSPPGKNLLRQLGGDEESEKPGEDGTAQMQMRKQAKTPGSKDVGAAAVVPSSVVRGQEAAGVLVSISGSKSDERVGRGGGEEEEGVEEQEA